MSKREMIETIRELDALGLVIQCDTDEHLIEALDSLEVCDAE